MNFPVTKKEPSIKEGPSFYSYYPELFLKYFNNVPRKHITVLSEAGLNYYNSILLLDKLVDDKQFYKIPEMLMLQEECIKSLTLIYGIESQFWKFWKKRKKEYFEAIKIEKKLSESQELEFENYEDLADKKSGFGKVAIDALYVLNPDKSSDIYQKLLLSHKYFSVGFQLYDDVKDFGEDLRKGQFNYAVYLLNREIPFKLQPWDINKLNKLLFIKGIGQKILTKSIKYFTKSIEILNKLNIQSDWLSTVYSTRKNIISYLEITNGYMAALITKLELKNKKTIHQNIFFTYDKINNTTIKNGLDFIKSDYEHNYAELKHIMFLGEIDGFKNRTPLHISDTFQRALLNDCLITVSDAYNLSIFDFLKKECIYLINLRNRDNIGGWSYFPFVNEVAADIDDLGQIIQLFLLSKNRQFITKYCSKSINTALGERKSTNGGIETWIVPISNQTKIQKTQEWFNSNKWGKGPDVEVNANFIFALTLLDKNKFYKIIEDSISFILNCQNNDGFWESRWYYGNYYGTYVCLRLLKHFKQKYEINIEKALSYLVEMQNEDGGYSMKSKTKSDPLSTALSVLSLKLFYKEDYIPIKKALTYLNKSQKENGSWDAVDFIKPKIHEPYKSKTLTTAFVLKALSLQ